TPTSHPKRASSSAIPFPIPLLAPVTRAVLPSRSVDIVLLRFPSFSAPDSPQPELSSLRKNNHGDDCGRRLFDRHGNRDGGLIAADRVGRNHQADSVQI